MLVRAGTKYPKSLGEICCPILGRSGYSVDSPKAYSNFSCSASHSTPHRSSSGPSFCWSLSNMTCWFSHMIWMSYRSCLSLEAAGHSYQMSFVSAPTSTVSWWTTILYESKLKSSSMVGGLRVNFWFSSGKSLFKASCLSRSTSLLNLFMNLLVIALFNTPFGLYFFFSTF
jgi:hypothetical protein